LTVADAIKHPTAGVIVLAEVTAPWWLRNWVEDVPGVTYRATLPDNVDVSSVLWNGAAMTQWTGGADLEDPASANQYIWNGSDLILHGPASASPFGNVIQAFSTFYFAKGDKLLDNRYWAGRLLNAPNLSSRIEAEFGGVGQIGGGVLVLNNSDKFFDPLSVLQWNAGRVTLKLGIDLPKQPMAWADFQTVATWLIEEWNRDNNEFTLRLIEPKAKLKTKIPFTFYSRTTYPNMEETGVGKAIPIAYGKCLGVKPVCIDIGLKKFKVAGHAIKQFDGVRVKKPAESFRDIVPAAGEWLLYSGSTYRLYLPGEEGKNVKFGSTDLTERKSIEAVIANAGSWTADENFVYVRPSGGETITSGTYTVRARKEVSSFQTVNFASVDPTNAEFTLGADYQFGADVSVDFTGKTSSGEAILNAASMVEDLLAIAGETNLNSSSFTEAKSRLKVGTDERAAEVCVRTPTVYLNEPRDLVDILSEINRLVGSYLYSDETGQYYFGVFEPERSEALTTLDDIDICDFREITETRGIVSKVSAQFAARKQDAFVQLAGAENEALERVNGQGTAMNVDEELAFQEEGDAKYWAERKLITNGLGIRKYAVSTKWQGLLWKPGRQLRLQYEARGVDEVVEIFEVRINYQANQVDLVLGNLRGFADTPGFWVDDADVLPTRFSTLSGYGAGSLAWNSSWDPEIKTWARQNVGYWTDENGLANSSDPDSFIPSAWV
jgi:hypothetical protein